MDFVTQAEPSDHHSPYQFPISIVSHIPVLGFLDRPEFNFWIRGSSLYCITFTALTRVHILKAFTVFYAFLCTASPLKNCYLKWRQHIICFISGSRRKENLNFGISNLCVHIIFQSLFLRIKENASISNFISCLVSFAPVISNLIETAHDSTLSIGNVFFLHLCNDSQTHVNVMLLRIISIMKIKYK